MRNFSLTGIKSINPKMAPQCEKLHREGRPASLQAALIRKKSKPVQRRDGSEKRRHTTAEKTSKKNKTEK